MQPSVKPPPSSPQRRGGIMRAIESKVMVKKSHEEYRSFIRRHYDGLAGKLTGFTGLVTGHETLAGRLIRPQAFDVRNCKRVLDAGCGNGRYSKYLLRWLNPDAVLTAFDLAPGMLSRARKRLNPKRVTHVAADLTRLPYPDSFFDAVVCGWVLEHLPDPRPGLSELARIMEPKGKLLLMVTEDTFTGTMCSRMWHCRTHNREELRNTCADLGLQWVKPHYFSPLHKWLKLGGIIVELHKE